MELRDLIGNHILTGVDYGTEKILNDFDEEYDGAYVIFKLDGIEYLASEDPEDGYRSCCNELKIVKNKIKNIFQPIEVLCKMRSDGDWGINDVLEIYDAINGKLILAIGTMNTDDYYPWFEYEYNPENMSINQK
ncbi:hypothetical protein ACFHWD_03255 [Clostridium sp. MT-14]|uniref:hypothetical protein n=1 Tax=Clostridium sp. MT-14 TaxID=3348360 RepID=UPI0035F23686